VFQSLIAHSTLSWISSEMLFLGEATTTAKYTGEVCHR
jgi:hypothetical protein